jgi:DoxX-like family
MVATTQSAPVSKGKLWTGRVFSGLVILFLLADSILKFFKPQAVVKGTLDLGYAESTIFGIGLTLFICTILYAVPRTSVLGAILLTGYLGGAVATNVRVGNPLFTHILFPVYLGILLWAGLYLRDERLSPLVPLRG